MTAVFFVYGLAFFSLGLAVLFEARRPSALALSHHLPWLAAFGLTHGLFEWSGMVTGLEPSAQAALSIARVVILPLSAALLVRFGVGLLGEAGPLPSWLTFTPPAILVVAALLAGYALVVAVTQAPMTLAAEVWSRYLLYLPGCLLASLGFVRQASRLPQAGLDEARPLLWGAAVAFALNAFLAGVLVPPAPYGLAPWLNSDLALRLTGLPVEIWRALSAVAVTVLVIRALDVFEAERRHELEILNAQGERAYQATLEAQSEARRVAEAWTNALVSISRSVANMDDVDAVLAAIVQTARQLLDADVAALGLWNETGLVLELKCFATLSAVELVSDRSMPIVDPWITGAVRDGQACRLPDEASEPSRPMCPALQRALGAACVVPLRLNGQSMGGLWVGREADRPFSRADLTGLERLGDQTVIALEHALMAARLQSLAVTEERSRIAREMHDGLAQVLGYLSLQTQTLEALVRRGDCAAALVELKQARGHILEAQADVRENILSLRTTLSGQVSLPAALEQYVEEFQVQTGIETEVVNTIAGEPRLSPLAEAQVVRIVQEALANVRKHAHAARVQVRLAVSGGALTLAIADDGCGMAAPERQRGHFGLATMRERAESVGGRLSIHSAIGDGTQVEIQLPLAQA
ncbi:MAG: ATP-binding protein [Anaerolineales bacterium]